MIAPTTHTLTVPGAELYYEVRGTGPPLLLIPSGNGDATPYGPLADLLADRYTVITYDRRGFSRSPLRAEPGGVARVSADADDARRLLDTVGGSPAYVFGTCSGGIVALALAERHPQQLGRTVVHEPPLLSVLVDAGRWLALHHDLHDIYRNDGIEAAQERFRRFAGLEAPTRPPPGYELPPEQLADLKARLARNLVFWFEHEITTYPAFVPDVPALTTLRDRLVLAGGRATRTHFSCRPTTALARRLGAELTSFPGGHVGHVTHPVEFAATLDRVLSGEIG